MGDVEAVVRIFVHLQPAVGDELHSPSRRKIERDGSIGISVNEKGRDRDGTHLLAPVGVHLRPIHVEYGTKRCSLHVAECPRHVLVRHRVLAELGGEVARGAVLQSLAEVTPPDVAPRLNHGGVDPIGIVLCGQSQR